MTDLDDFFGPKPEDQEIKLTKNLHGWRCSDRLWSTLDMFVKEWQELMPIGSKSSLYASCKELLTEIGEPSGPRFVRWASSIIKHEKPELLDGIKDLRSFKFLIGRWRREKGGDLCPDCGEHYSSCECEWGSQRRQAKYQTE